MNHTLSRWVGLFSGLVLIGSFCLLPASPALADTAPITLTEILPASLSNDVDTPVEIIGTGFSNVDGLPKVFLGSTALRDVAWASDQKLTAVVPWGLAPASYALKVVNPDGGEASLADAVEVTQGIGQWNSQALDGGPVQTVLPAKTSGLVYAYSNVTNALYKSTDSAANWTTVGHVGGQFLSLDPNDPDVLYLDSMRSSDGGATWEDMLPDHTWPGGGYAGWYTHPFPDPNPAHSGTVFLASAEIPDNSGSASGLLRSTDHGQSWTTVEEGLLTGDTHVTAMAFGPDAIYLGTRDGNLYQSTDGGDHWSRVGTASLLPSIGILAINPYKTSEMWVATHFETTATANMLKIDLTDPTNPAKQADVWDNAGDYPMTIGFISQEKAFISTRWDRGWVTENGGTNWYSFNPGNGKPGNCLSIDPNDPNTFYMADEQYGVQKTTNGGATWTVANKGLHAMAPDILAVDPSNPARVYSKISQNGWPGIYRSQDGGQNWAFSLLSVSTDPPELADYRPITSTLAANASRVFVGAHGNGVVDKNGWGPNLYVSDDQGTTWKRILVDTDPLMDPNPDHPNYFYMPWALQVDPNNERTLVMTAVIGNRGLTTDQYFSEIYRSTDNGDNWQRINIKTQLGHDVLNLRYVAFDPSDSDVVYAAADREILKSTDNGVTWVDVKQVGVDQWVGSPIAIEPVAPFRVYAGGLVSTDAGATWNPTNLPMNGNAQMAFVPGSDTLYMAGNGLQVSLDGGDTWQSASGGLASASISALTVAKIESRIVVYVGTPGGDALAGAGLTGQGGAALEAGVYRNTQIHANIYFPLVKR